MPCGGLLFPHSPLALGNVRSNITVKRSERNTEMEVEAIEREHHKRAEVAYNRPDYREARWERAVKVRASSFANNTSS